MARSQAQRLASETFQRLKQQHPNAHCELQHQDPFQLLVATVLSAQTTDVIVNQVTPDLWARYPSPEALSQAQPEELEPIINRMGMFRQKAKNITRLAQQLVANHGAQVPPRLADLVALPGVGRKTANVVLGVAFAAPEGVVVDTHVQRLSQRLGWTKHSSADKIELDLIKLFPPADWDTLSHTLIFHGRSVCSARAPACARCSVASTCPSVFRAENIGRKPTRARRAARGGPTTRGPKK